MPKVENIEGELQFQINENKQKINKDYPQKSSELYMK